MTARLIEIENLNYRYPDGTPALDGVSLAVGEGERTALLGPNGAGKSTLLLHLNGLLRPTEGRVAIGGVTVSEESARDVRRRVGLVFQDPDDQLFLPTLLDDVAFGLLNQGLDRAIARHRSLEILDALGLDGAGDRAAHHLSSGEKRLAALATVLVLRPSLLALDEPTSNLDGRGKKRLVEMLQSRDETLLIATHDLELAGALCSRAVVLESGAVAHDGPAEDLLGNREMLEDYGLALPLSS